MDGTGNLCPTNNFQKIFFLLEKGIRLRTQICLFGHFFLSSVKAQPQKKFLSLYEPRPFALPNPTQQRKREENNGQKELLFRQKKYGIGTVVCPGPPKCTHFVLLTLLYLSRGCCPADTRRGFLIIEDSSRRRVNCPSKNEHSPISSIFSVKMLSKYFIYRKQKK